ncbi:MAG: CPBP family intramembrane glutamic endopeptidase [Patescibacteria group bacterium]
MATNKDKSNDRFGKLIEEQNTVDFPYYNDKPVKVETWKWIVAWASTFVGFLVLSFYPASNNIESILPRILFMAIPLVTFALLLRTSWKAIFKKPRLKDYWLMVVFAAFNMVLTPILALLVTVFGFPTAGNAAGDGLVGAGAGELLAFYTGTAIQLLGEELIVIIPFLATLSILHLRFGVSRKKAILWAWLISAIWFGALHLPTYQWNIIQVMVIIAGARIALTLAFIRTKNIWVSTGAHIINDWVLFTVLMITAMLR